MTDFHILSYPSTNLVPRVLSYLRTRLIPQLVKFLPLYLNSEKGTSSWGKSPVWAITEGYLPRVHWNIVLNLCSLWLITSVVIIPSVEGNLTHSKDAPPEDDVDLTYQHGSVNHPAHEMYPMCHHCPKNSTYEECTHKRTLKRCDSGLSNICFTKSIKRDNIVHYNMGCANHKQCQRARAKPCKGKRVI